MPGLLLNTASSFRMQIHTEAKWRLILQNTAFIKQPDMCKDMFLYRIFKIYINFIFETFYMCLFFSQLRCGAFSVSLNYFFLALFSLIDYL